MKQFFKFTFASALGFLITFIVIILILFGVISASLSFAEKKTVLVSEQSVLHVKLNYPINDRGVTDFNFTGFSSFMDESMGLIDILENIEKAKQDDNIEGIFLDLRDIQAGLATVQEIRDALIEFKESGKFIVSYSEFYSQTSYYLATVSDSVVMHPEGDMMFKGINAEVTFFKDMLEKLDVEAQIIRHGKFKSAVEPFMMDHMSEANKEQTRTFIQSVWDKIVDDIATGRELSNADINDIADRLLIQTADDAKELGLADLLMYEDEVMDLLKEKSGRQNDDKPELVKLTSYKDAIVEELRQEVPRNKIAVVFAEGSIQTEKGGELTISSDVTAKHLRKARQDTTVKAIVFRVNSPGGSALASDVIWRETVLAAKEKPFIVSMGDLAASGGYYIAAGADKIIANPTTLTGSIGVFGVIPNMEGLLTDKIGLDFDNVKTNDNAGFVSVNRPLTEYEREVLQKGVEKTYEVFTSKVAEGRNMTMEEVNEIGQGRVWSGVDAKKIGLIDEFGGLKYAMNRAAEMADIPEDDYRVLRIPEKKAPLEELIDEIIGRNSSVRMKSELGPLYDYYDYIKEVTKMQGTQARLPYQITIK